MNLEARELEEQYILRVKDPALAEQLRCRAAAGSGSRAFVCLPLLCRCCRCCSSVPLP